MAEAPCKTVYIQPSTGGQIEVKVPHESSVICLKKAIAKRLKVPRERIVLLHKNRQLIEGTLEENKVQDGAKLTLLPSVETGLAPQRPEQNVMQALETLNDSQVDNFLAGRSPLNLSLRLGDHMMFIQLQLSTVPETGVSDSTASAASSPLPTPPTTPTTPDSPSTALHFPTAPAASSTPLSPPPSPKMTVPATEPDQPAEAPKLNTKALAEASKNLTHTLRKLSAAALNKKSNENCTGRCCTVRPQGGAVIESMFHHGRGVYSGTFSGTLSPSLQDKDGRPRRDISTVIYILNDLLGASAHCRRSAQCFCPTSSSSSSPPSPPPPSSPQTLQQVLSSTLKVKVDGQKKEEENKVLKQKVEQIQSMLEQRRQRRKGTRDHRSCPYSSPKSQQECPSPDSAFRTSDQIMADYSSGTAVA